MTTEERKLVARGIAGDAFSQYLVGLIYSCRTPTKANRRNAFKWFLQSANGNCARGQYMTALFYSQGLFPVKRSAKHAFYWYKKACRQGLPEAVLAIARCYATGQGTKKDLRKSVCHYLLLCKMGYPDTAVPEISKIVVNADIRVGG